MRQRIKLASDHLNDDSTAPSKDLEDCGWREDIPRYCERDLRLLPFQYWLRERNKFNQGHVGFILRSTTTPAAP